MLVGSIHKKRGCSGPLPLAVNLLIHAPVHTAWREREGREYMQVNNKSYLPSFVTRVHLTASHFLFLDQELYLPTAK